MDFLQIEERVNALLASGRFDEAESELQRARVEASKQRDLYTLDLVLMELMRFYCVIDPPDFQKAEMYALERERVEATGYSKSQTALLYYWNMHDPARSLLKVDEAVESANSEKDTKTIYQCLALRGLALLDLGRTGEAADVLLQIRTMITERRRIVVGDETLFLERLCARTQEPTVHSVIKTIANTLAPVCRDTTFAERLRALAGH